MAAEQLKAQSHHNMTKSPEMMNLWQYFVENAPPCARYGEADQPAVPGWTPADRPSHSLRFNSLVADLTLYAFVRQPPHEAAFYWIACSLNQQLAVMQAAQIMDMEGERLLRSPFALGYVFGVAANFVDECGVRRPSAGADNLVVRAHQEALGPLSEATIAKLSAEASQAPQFGDGMAAGGQDALLVHRGRASMATALAHYVTSRRPYPGQAQLRGRPST